MSHRAGQQAQALYRANATTSLFILDPNHPGSSPVPGERLTWM